MCFLNMKRKANIILSWLYAILCVSYERQRGAKNMGMKIYRGNVIQTTRDSLSYLSKRRKFWNGVLLLLLVTA